MRGSLERRGLVADYVGESRDKERGNRPLANGGTRKPLNRIGVRTAASERIFFEIEIGPTSAPK